MKKFVLGIVLVLTVFMLGGCFKKSAITTNEFKTKAEKNGYQVVNVNDQYANYQAITEANVALSDKGYQVEFYVLTTDTEAQSMFNTNKDAFEAQKTGTNSETSATMANYDTYTLNNNGQYVHLCRVDNTFFYAHVTDTYKEEVKAFVEELGY